METLQKEKSYEVPCVIDPKHVDSAWQLTYSCLNSQGSKGFGGRMLTSYVHPITKKTVHLYNADNQRLAGFMIDNISMTLRPGEDANHRLQVLFLLGHPDVKVEGVNYDSRIRKNGGSQIKIVNLDLRDMKDLDEQDIIDQMIGKLSLETGPEAIGLKRLRWLLSYFNLPYFDMRYVTNPSAEKKLLRRKIKDFARALNPVTKKYNAIEMKSVIDQIDSFQMLYEVKEMVRHFVVQYSNGSMKYNNVPLGTDVPSVVEWFKQNPSIYHEALSKLLPLLNDEGFKVK